MATSLEEWAGPKLNPPHLICWTLVGGVYFTAVALDANGSGPPRALRLSETVGPSPQDLEKRLSLVAR